MNRDPTVNTLFVLFILSKEMMWVSCIHHFGEESCFTTVNVAGCLGKESDIVRSLIIKYNFDNIVGTFCLPLQTFFHVYFYFRLCF